MVAAAGSAEGGRRGDTVQDKERPSDAGDGQCIQRPSARSQRAAPESLHATRER